MPTLKSYVSKDGYYINARPSDVGNVTYQVDPSIWEFFEDMGYSHESEIPWGLIKPFRLAGLIYTERGGVDDIDKDIPELDPSKLSTLSVEAIETLLEYFETRGDLSASVKDKIRAYILTHRGSTSSDLADEIRSVVNSTLRQVNGLSMWTVDEVAIDSKKDHVSKTTEIKIRIKQGLFSIATLPEFVHTISITELSEVGEAENYTTWKTDVEGDYSWDVGIEILQQKASLAEDLKETLTEHGFKLGKPPKLV